jgi:glycosyltransferase involved in cell wall biosynthesis
MKAIVLPVDITAQLQSVGAADVVVGIPSYNNAHTIGHVVRAVQTGFAKYFPEKACIIVNSDGGSVDGTTDIVQNTTIDDYHAIMIHHQVKPAFKIITPYHGTPGKGSAFRTIFEIASALRAHACAVVDSDLRSITPEWVELLIKPVLEHNFDYVAPLYHRHKFDGTITNSIVYPLTRALYGKQVRQPIGGDFGFSGNLARYYLTKDVWETDVARYGIDVWMTTTAIANGFKVCQAFLGAKIHDPKDPGSDLSSMLYQVVGATFGLMEDYYEVWKEVRSSEEVPTFGFRYGVGIEPVSVNLDRMIEKFRLGMQELREMWALFIPEPVLEHLEHLESLPADSFHIPDDVWVDIVYAYALAMHRKVMNPEHLLKSLTPLYIGRTASFVTEHWTNEAPEVEKQIEELCALFEKKKGAFLHSWNKKGG